MIGMHDCPDTDSIEVKADRLRAVVVTSPHAVTLAGYAPGVGQDAKRTGEPNSGRSEFGWPPMSSRSDRLLADRRHRRPPHSARGPGCGSAHHSGRVRGDLAGPVRQPAVALVADNGIRIHRPDAFDQDDPRMGED